MKRYILLIVLSVCISQTFAQRVEIYYDDPVSRIVDVPVYLFQRYCPSENVIKIDDDSFANYLNTKISTFNNDTNNHDNPLYERMPYAMIQIIYIESDYEYHIINMSHSTTAETLDKKNGYLIVDGQNKVFDKSFQTIIDQIVNYHIKNPRKTINIQYILNGGKYNIDPYLPK